MENLQTYNWVSVGGGAAGYFGAINFAENQKRAGNSVKVLILEAGGKTLSKAKVSGGGRCNVTHNCFEPKDLVSNYPRGSKELLSVFHQFQPKDTIAWFENRGVSLKTEEDGRMFPVTDDSQTVIDCFEKERTCLGIDLRVRSTVQDVRSTERGLLLKMNGGQDILAKHVLVASGSSKSMWSLLESAGHTIVSPVPSLFSFNTKDRRLKNQSGRSFQHVELKGKIGSRTLKAAGPMLITHWGLSGPAILKLSSIFARELFDVDYHTQIQINFLPSLNQEETERVLKEHQEKNDKKKLKNSSIKVFPLSYWVNLLETIGIQPNMMWADVSNVNRARLVQEISAATFEITGKTTNKEEFVTAGGVELKEVNFQSMESQRVPNLYFAGEVLNIDGLTGGFNFQSAWSTSFIAARSASHDMTKD